MNEPAPERMKSLLAKAEAKALAIRTSKLMMSSQRVQDELEQALADQIYCCAWAEAWGELCREATDRIIELQPPG